MYHPGVLEPDWENEFWCDTDPDVHDVTPDDESREYFIWTCCSDDGWQRGCRTGSHIAEAETKRFKHH